ncbi:ABC transporter permease [Ruminococcus sp. LCP21S3_E8]
MRIICSEIKKLFKSKIIIVALLLFIALDFTNIYRNYNVSSGFRDMSKVVTEARVVLQKNLDGKITDEKVNLIKTQVEKLSKLESGEFSRQKEPDSQFMTGYAYYDSYLWGIFNNYIDRSQQYSEELSEKLDTSKENIDYYKGRNDYYVRENTLYQDTYSKRQIEEIYDTENLPDYFQYSFSAILIIIMLLLGVVPVFSGECESDMDIILNTTPLGRRKTILGKISSTLIYTVLVTLIFSACDFIAFLVFGNMDGLNQKLYALDMFNYAPVDMKVWQFILVMFAIKLLGMIILSLVFLLCSRLFKNSVTPFITGMIIFVLLMLCRTLFTTHTGDVFNMLNPVSLIIYYSYFTSFSVVNVFGSPVFMYQLSVVSGILIMIALILLIALMPLKIELPKIKGRVKK